jgi:hypothetical protein
MKTYGGSGYIDQRILEVVPAALPPEKEPLVPIGQEAGWDAEPVWTIWRRENS